MTTSRRCLQCHETTPADALHLSHKPGSADVGLRRVLARDREREIDVEHHLGCVNLLGGHPGLRPWQQPADGRVTDREALQHRVIAVRQHLEGLEHTTA